MADILPYVTISWTAPTPTGDEVFSHYLVERQHPRTGVWVDVATLTDIDVPEYDDYLAFPGLQSYRVRWVADVLGAQMESEPVEATATLVFPHGAWLHEVQDDSEQVLVQATRLSRAMRMDATPRMARGTSRAPVMSFGPRFAAEYGVTPVPETLGDRTGIEALLRLAERQWEQGSTLCLRIGATSERRFVVLTDVPEDLEAGLSRSSATAMEVDFDEAAWAAGDES